MKKLTLNLDELQVRSFDTGSADGKPGTVHGNAITTRACPPDTEYWTCGIWCPPTTDPAVTGPCAC